jgi:hypothetical protein
LQCYSQESCNSNKIFAAKERKDRKDKDLCRFFFAIYAFFCGQFVFGCGPAALQCYLRKLCIFGKVFPPLFSPFPPVQILWLRLAALRLGDFALKNLLYP